MENKEIIVLMVCLGVGGAERVLTELTNEWVKLGCSVTILLREPIDYLHDYDINSNIKVLQLKSKGKTKVIKRITSAISLLKYLNLHRQATVVAFLNPMIRMLGMIMPFIKNRLVFSERCDPYHSPKARINRIIRNELYKRADFCVFQTQEAKAYFSTKVQAKSTVIPNPVNPELLDMYTGERKKEIVAACQLIPQKNVPMLLKAFSKLHPEHPEYDLYIYGRGPLKDELEELSRELGIASNTHFPGFAKNINEFMNSAKMFVSSSNYEGISNSMLEALGMGVPTVCTDCPIGGAREMIDDGVNGVLVPVGDDNSLYLAMKRIIEEPDFANRISQNAVLIRYKYPVDKIAKEWLRIL